MDASVRAPAAGVDGRDTSTGTTVTVRGPLDTPHVGPLWTRAVRLGTGSKGRALTVDLSGVDGFDTAGAALIVAIEGAHGDEARIEGAAPEVAELLARVRAASRGSAPAPAEPPRSWRRSAGETMTMIGDGVAFLGETAVATVRLPRRRKMARASEFWRVADEVGVRAVPLVVLLGTLIGLIMAFQSLAPLRRFGAELYTANLVAISLLRELGPLMTAVILAGRTGSAFAAEIGTMKVNEELDAIATLGIDRTTMLVLPRLAAATLVMPALTVLLELSGLLGMLVVLRGFGFSTAAVAHQVEQWVHLRDLWGGLFKAAVFGAVIAAIGCRSGIATGVGPRAVGLSATKAVVGGIVASIVLDGVFSLVFYRLGL